MAAPLKSGLLCSFQYDAELFQPATVQRLAAHYHHLLQGISASPGAYLAELPMLSPAEKEQVLRGWNPPQPFSPPRRALPQRFEAAVARTPQAVAVIHNEQRLSFAELNRRANRWAYALRAWGVGPEVRSGSV
jgi:non-ribosomal peptide synthetase component F